MAESVKQRTNALSCRRDSLELRKLLDAALADLRDLRDQFNQLRTDYNAHVHGGVTAGGANTDAPTATTAAAVALDLTD